MSDITEILAAAQQGDSSAGERLIAVVYGELRAVAAGMMAREGAGHTLQPTALVHEAWLRLGGDEQPAWQNRAHFFGAAAEAMRRILVGRARQKMTLKRGGGLQRVELEEIDMAAAACDDEDLLFMDDALDRLPKVSQRAADMVKLCFFAGFTQEEAARELGVSLKTAERTWGFARSWLSREVRKLKDGVAAV